MSKLPWTFETTKRLFTLCAEAKSRGLPVRQVHAAFAAEMGMSEGSVRNYYYANLKVFSTLPTSAVSDLPLPPLTRPFEEFGEGEAERLLRDILIARGRGLSVRAAVILLSNNDEKAALRYQNKYRSLVFCHRERTERVIADLIRERATFFHPYEARLVTDGVSTCKTFDPALEAERKEHTDKLMEIFSRLGANESELDALKSFVKNITPPRSADSHGEK